MFKAEGMRELLRENQRVLADLVKLEVALNERFADMDDAVRCLVLSVASGEPMLLVGPPGTAKSRLIRVFCMLTGLLEPPKDASSKSANKAKTAAPALTEVERSPAFFTYLLTEFTEPAELFGYFDIGKLVNEPHQLVKMDEHAMQRARVVFLDEVFNAGSAILNALLTFMNEREIHERGKILKTPMQCFFSASNHTPTDGHLAAVYDRFVLRCWLDNEPSVPGRITKLVDLGWKETHGGDASNAPSGEGDQFTGLLDGVLAMQRHLQRLTATGTLEIDQRSDLFERLASIVELVRKKRLSSASNRRLIKFARIMLLNRLLDYAAEEEFDPKSPTLRPEDLRVFLQFGLDQHDGHLLKQFGKDPARWPLHRKDAPGP